MAAARAGSARERAPPVDERARGAEDGHRRRVLGELGVLGEEGLCDPEEAEAEEVAEEGAVDLCGDGGALCLCGDALQAALEEADHALAEGGDLCVGAEGRHGPADEGHIRAQMSARFVLRST